MPRSQTVLVNKKWMITRPARSTVTKPDAATQPHPGNDGMTEVNRMRIIPEKISAEAEQQSQRRRSKARIDDRENASRAVQDRAQDQEANALPARDQKRGLELFKCFRSP